MALSNQIESIKFDQGSGTPSWTSTLLLGNDYEIVIDPLFYTGSPYDPALSGFLRQNFRGYRPRISISWERNIEASDIRTLRNNIMSSFATDNDDFIYFYPDASAADKFKVVLDEGNVDRTQYSHTVGRYSSSINLISLYPINSDNPDGITTIPAWLEGPG